MMGAVDARALVARLGAAYRGLAGQGEPKALNRSPFRAFEGWFQSAVPGETPEVYEQFLREVAEVCAGLVDALPGVLDERERAELALEAVRMMLAPKPLHGKAQREWYQIVAEGNAAGLLPFLDEADLAQLKAEYQRANPRHMMYPCQRQVMRKMERRRRGTK